MTVDLNLPLILAGAVVGTTLGLAIRAIRGTGSSLHSWREDHRPLSADDVWYRKVPSNRPIHSSTLPPTRYRK